MEKGLKEGVNFLEASIERLISELSSLYSVGNQMSANERIEKTKKLLALADVVLGLEEKIFALRNATEKAEGRRDYFLCALKAPRASIPPRAEKKYRS